jgi:hypothetical protein
LPVLTVDNVSPIEEPDKTFNCLVLEREEMLFKTLEKHIVSKQGFGENRIDVDDFISFSLRFRIEESSCWFCF